MNAKRLTEICAELDACVRPEDAPNVISGRGDVPFLDCMLTWGELRDMAIELQYLQSSLGLELRGMARS